MGKRVNLWFIVDLQYLSDPKFLRLLEKAEEEFGFEQVGALALPCRPDDLQRILENRRKEVIMGCTV
ncbi:hypothetical protein GIB67_000259 [Kingdonia uniflora]|uniref:Uncharacterized protein n=1 Tax=Kingdonia uniflora TaxID=39325 RepID=A0A7J7LC08_9MAGN|nr:hypothetical protein GIB67_000259 [Kingdonia uniflora]